jgi:hypothetical protein
MTRLDNIGVAELGKAATQLLADNFYVHVAAE